MNTRWMGMTLAAAMLLTVGGLQAAKEESASKEFKATCPVSGKPAGESHMVQLKNGDKVYFCCDNCPKAFKQNPAKYNLGVHRQLLETGQVVQVACPFDGNPASKEHMVEMGDVKIGFCSDKCEEKFKSAADDAAKLKLAFANGPFNKGFTRQTMCPVSGKPINPEHSVEYKGKKVYFCCPNCPAAFEKDPEKYADKLPQLKEKPAKGKKEKAA